uniref:Ovule protein n=1 Tax=Anisakis simplex TaxID=6269 RepID=A0A0M3JNX5_ANISI
LRPIMRLKWLQNGRRSRRRSRRKLKRAKCNIKQTYTHFHKLKSTMDVFR